MMIYHILKNGKHVDSIEGITIDPETFPEIYRMMESIEAHTEERKEG